MKKGGHLLYVYATYKNKKIKLFRFIYDTDSKKRIIEKITEIIDYLKESSLKYYI